nr:COP9 signalosome complex subunit 7-like isoform X3 [Ipomoea batatas]
MIGDRVLGEASASSTSGLSQMMMVRHGMQGIYSRLGPPASQLHPDANAILRPRPSETPRNDQNSDPSKITLKKGKSAHTDPPRDRRSTMDPPRSILHALVPFTSLGKPSSRWKVEGLKLRFLVISKMLRPRVAAGSYHKGEKRGMQQTVSTWRLPFRRLGRGPCCATRRSGPTPGSRPSARPFNQVFSCVGEADPVLLSADYRTLGIVRGKLDQLRRCFEVQFAAGRDLRPGQLGSMIHTLTNWLTTSDNLLVSIQEKIKWADTMSELDKKHKKDMEEKVEDVKKSLSFKSQCTLHLEELQTYSYATLSQDIGLNRN